MLSKDRSINHNDFGGFFFFWGGRILIERRYPKNAKQYLGVLPFFGEYKIQVLQVLSKCLVLGIIMRTAQSSDIKLFFKCLTTAQESVPHGIKKIHYMFSYRKISRTVSGLTF